MGVVPQEPVLFDRSIKENIKYGKSDATDEEIENSAKDANAHEFITELKEGYDTNVGESGSQISGNILFLSTFGDSGSQPYKTWNPQSELAVQCFFHPH